MLVDTGGLVTTHRRTVRARLVANHHRMVTPHLGATHRQGVLLLPTHPPAMAAFLPTLLLTLLPALLLVVVIHLQLNLLLAYPTRQALMSRP